jgi:zinc-ribbon domain
MFCPRCHTELPDSASICSQCGSPVFVASPLQAQTATFSYLPSGTPQWPTSASSPFPYNAATQTAYAPDDSLQELEPGGPERKRKPGSLSLPAVLLLIFVSILIGGGLAYGSFALQNRANGPQQPTHPISLTPVAKTTPTPGAQSSTPTPAGNQLPTPLSFQQGISPDLKISIQYPAGWTQGQIQQSSNGNKDIAFRPSTQIPVTLFVLQISAANSAQLSSTSDINTGLITSFGTNSNLSSPQMLTNTPTNLTIGGVSWDEQDAVFGANTASSLHVASLAVKHTVYYYEILFYAPTSAYDEAMSKYYTKMLDSFKFTA